MEAQRKEGGVEPQDSNLFVFRLPIWAEERDLLRAFSAFGAVRSCKVIRDDKGVSRAFGFVSFTSQEEALAAIEGLNDTYLEPSHETLIRMRKAPPPPPPPDDTRPSVSTPVCARPSYPGGIGADGLERRRIRVKLKSDGEAPASASGSNTSRRSSPAPLLPSLTCAPGLQVPAAATSTAEQTITTHPPSTSAATGTRLSSSEAFTTGGPQSASRSRSSHSFASFVSPDAAASAAERPLPERISPPTPGQSPFSFSFASPVGAADSRDLQKNALVSPSQYHIQLQESAQGPPHPTAPQQSKLPVPLQYGTRPTAQGSTDNAASNIPGRAPPFFLTPPLPRRRLAPSAGRILSPRQCPKQVTHRDHLNTSHTLGYWLVLGTHSPPPPPLEAPILHTHNPQAGGGVPPMDGSNLSLSADQPMLHRQTDFISASRQQLPSPARGSHRPAYSVSSPSASHGHGGTQPPSAPSPSMTGYPHCPGMPTHEPFPPPGPSPLSRPPHPPRDLSQEEVPRLRNLSFSPETASSRSPRKGSVIHMLSSSSPSGPCTTEHVSTPLLFSMSSSSLSNPPTAYATPVVSPSPNRYWPLRPTSSPPSRNPNEEPHLASAYSQMSQSAGETPQAAYHGYPSSFSASAYASAVPPCTLPTPLTHGPPSGAPQPHQDEPERGGRTSASSSASVGPRHELTPGSWPEGVVTQVDRLRASPPMHRRLWEHIRLRAHGEFGAARRSSGGCHT
uniref:RRM domain-containing protein n=1 Tax=Chromera velia CCMP2878 TaxID=1169474 RepID=A0A0G4HDY9_9ALVE|eukprot:Cvel_6501.t1-p1 / transcript=Cvel_6501.t1 / gene=Cvel_6501 / organism=Chromera_velia_CCMP2878 / gene_product=Polyadenylate-binding protein 8, putative / transcript_product=Polyadenylate-binding protein 8, putative / location=Cvel_scaffold319:22209-25032(-) / protein_length=731 / sequence_SO=supercontig / SO=protein_coding / is_pseudo=false